MKIIKQATLLFAMTIFAIFLVHSQTTPLSVKVIGSRITCNGANNGSITTLVQGGTSPYTYLWNNNATTSSINGLAPGIYSVNVTDAATNTASASYTITQPAMLNAFIDNTDISCNGGSDGTASPININGGSSIQVKVNSPNVAIFNATGALFGPSTFNVTANVVYIPDNSSTFSGCNPFPPGSLTGKIALIDRIQSASDCFFVVKVQNAQDAGAIGVIIVNFGTFTPLTMSPPPGGGTTITIPSVMIGSFDANPIKALLANGTMVNLSLKSGNQYSWSNGGTTSAISGLSAGSYNLTVTDLNGCTAVSNSIVITNPPALTLTTGATNLTCNKSNDGAASANVTGGNLNCRVTNLSRRTSGVSGRAFGLFPTNPPSLIITGQNFVACNTGFITSIRMSVSSSASTFITPLMLAPGTSTSNPAYTQMVTIPAAGGYFIFDLTTPFPVIAGNTYSFSLGGPGSTGFTGLNFSTIDYPNGNVFLENNVQRPTDDLAFEVKISGTANFPYTYLWSNGATSNSIKVLAAGNYSVTATDSRGCTKSANITLAQPDVLTVDAGPNKIVYKGFPDSACARLQSSGATGGTAPYTLTWSNGSHASFIDVCPTETTDYTLTITDANGCTFTDNVKVCVIDVRCGNKLDKVTVSHRTGSASNPCVTICVDINSARNHFRNHPGDQLGSCGMIKECNWPGEERLITSRSVTTEVSQNKFEHFTVYPNPFSGKATIRFTSSENGYVKIKLIDITGREIAKLYAGAIEAGTSYTVPLNASKLNNGIYLLTMTNDKGITETRKLILSK